MEQLQLTVSREENEVYKLLFRRGRNNVEVEKCTKNELIMMKKVIEKVLD